MWESSSHVTTIGDVLDSLERAYPRASAAAWDNPGLQVGDLSAPVTRVLTALDPTLEVIREATARGAQLVVTHHPLLFDPLTSVDVADPVVQVVAEALAANVAVIACHTNADVATPGVSDALAAALGLAVEGPLVAEPPYGGTGRIGTFGAPTSVASLVVRCTAALGGQPRLIGDSTVLLSRIAVCGGSGAAYLPDAIAAGVDAFVTGDIKHHAALDARAAGMIVIDAGHHATEWPWVLAVAEELPRWVPALDAIVSDTLTDPFAGTPPGAVP